MRGNKGSGDALLSLDDLWNADKHRILNTTPQYVREADAVLPCFRFIPDIQPVEARPLVGPERPLKDGTLLALYRFPLDQPMPEVKVDRPLPMQVALSDDEGKGERGNLRETLALIRDLVRKAKALK